MSQDVFQTKTDHTFEGCEGVAGIADNIVVFGITIEEHNHNLHVMLWCQGTGLKLNPNKCSVKQEKIIFYGVVCGKEGIQPDPCISIETNVFPNKPKRTTQTFLGMANYMSPFAPNLSALTAPPRELLKGNYQFHWNPAHSLWNG